MAFEPDSPECGRLGLPAEIFRKVMEFAMPTQPRTLDSALKLNKPNQSCLPLLSVNRAFYQEASYLLYNDYGRAEITINVGTYNHAAHIFTPPRIGIWAMKFLQRFSHVHLRIHFQRYPISEDTLLCDLSYGLRTVMAWRSHQGLEFKIRFSLVPTNTTPLPGRYPQHMWGCPHLQAIIQPFEWLFRKLNCHPLEIIDVPEMLCRLKPLFPHQNFSDNIDMYRRWLLQHALRADNNNLSRRRISLVVAPNPQWDTAVLFQNLHNDVRQGSTARSTAVTLLSAVDNEVLTLERSIVRARCELDDTIFPDRFKLRHELHDGIITGHFKLQRVFRKLHASNRKMIQDIGSWLWEADTGLDRIRAQFRDWQDRKQAWKEAVEAQRMLEEDEKELVKEGLRQVEEMEIDDVDEEDVNEILDVLRDSIEL